MTLRSPVKAPRAGPPLVAVISAVSDLDCALRLRRLPDFFEVRLDALCREISDVAEKIQRLRAPLIITARHAAEGGFAKLSADKRRDLLLQFLPSASYVDIELRSLDSLGNVLKAAGRMTAKLIISHHDLTRTPSIAALTEFADTAQRRGAVIFKVATRTDTREDLARLLEFFDRNSGQILLSAMGIGKFGSEVRRLLARRGSVLNYVPLCNAQAKGQLSLRAMRRELDRRQSQAPA